MPGEISTEKRDQSSFLLELCVSQFKNNRIIRTAEPTQHKVNTAIFSNVIALEAYSDFL